MEYCFRTSMIPNHEHMIFIFIKFKVISSPFSPPTPLAPHALFSLYRQPGPLPCSSPSNITTTSDQSSLCHASPWAAWRPATSQRTASAPKETNWTAVRGQGDRTRRVGRKPRCAPATPIQPVAHSCYSTTTTAYSCGPACCRATSIAILTPIEIYSIHSLLISSLTNSQTQVKKLKVIKKKNWSILLYYLSSKGQKLTSH
jgi:hypothetical protein